MYAHFLKKYWFFLKHIYNIVINWFFRRRFENVSQNTSSGSGNSAVSGDDDEAYNEVVEFAIQTGKISASLIQRRFRFGYNRAARMMDLLEARGIVGPQNGSKPREVLVKLEKNGNDE